MSLLNSLNQTNLDIQNKNPLGGPNRTNSANIPGGSYINIKSTNNYNPSPNFNSQLQMVPNQPFSFQNNDIIQLHRYLPNDILGGQTYMDIINLDPNNL